MLVSRINRALKDAGYYEGTEQPYMRSVLKTMVITSCVLFDRNEVEAAIAMLSNQPFIILNHGASTALVEHVLCNAPHENLRDLAIDKLTELLKTAKFLDQFYLRYYRLQLKTSNWYKVNPDQRKLMILEFGMNQNEPRLLPAKSKL